MEKGRIQHELKVSAWKVLHLYLQNIISQIFIFIIIKLEMEMLLHLRTFPFLCKFMLLIRYNR